MKHIACALLALILIVSSALAQQQQATNQRTGGTTAKNEEALRFPPIFQSETRGIAADSITSSARKPLEHFVVTIEPNFVFKEGALHLSTLNPNLFLPVSGGGRSGCFRQDLQGLVEILIRLR